MTQTAALLDRLPHHSHIVQISGDSYRLRGEKAVVTVPLQVISEDCPPLQRPATITITATKLPEISW